MQLCTYHGKTVTNPGTFPTSWTFWHNHALTMNSNNLQHEPKSTHQYNLATNQHINALIFMLSDAVGCEGLFLSLDQQLQRLMTSQ